MANSFEKSRVVGAREKFKIRKGRNLGLLAKEALGFVMMKQEGGRKGACGHSGGTKERGEGELFAHLVCSNLKK